VLSAADEEGSTWHHNSFSITDDLVASDGIDPFTERTDAVAAPRYFLAPTEDEAIFNGEHAGDDCQVEPCGARLAVWPGTMVFDSERDRALIFYGLIHAEPGDFNFRGVGQSIALWERFEEAPTRPEVSPAAEHPTLLFAEGEPPWGTAAVIEGEDLFVFACDSDEDGFSPPCRLARVATADVLDRSAWSYWDGSDWSEEMDDATVLFGGAPSVTISSNAYLGAWTALYATPLSNEVVMRTAPELTGPWSEPGLMFVAEREEEGAYDGNAHPELEEEEGRVLYVTFSRPNGDGWFGSDFALVRVELP
jgi:hypothetical protein